MSHRPSPWRSSYDPHNDQGSGIVSMPPLTYLPDLPPSEPPPAGEESFDDGFRRLFGDRFSGLYRYLHRLTGDAALADDLAQEAFVRLYQRGAMPGDPAAWLVTVAHNLLRDEHRRTARRGRLLALRREPPASMPSPDEDLLLNERAAQVRQALGTLSPRQAQLLLLRHEGHSYNEIASIVGVAPGSVGTLLVRATAAFAAAFRRTNDASD